MEFSLTSQLNNLPKLALFHFHSVGTAHVLPSVKFASGVMDDQLGLENLTPFVWLNVEAFFVPEITILVKAHTKVIYQ